MEKIIELGEKRIILIGTAHISKKSVEEVDAAIEAHRPDTVCVELCPSRYEAIKNQDHWKQMDIVKVIREGRAPLLMANLILSAFQKKMGDQLGVRPGAEMVEAIRKAEEVGARTELCDREVSQTLKRAWASLSFWEKIKLSSHLMGSLFESPKISENEIENLKEADILNEAIAEMAEGFPSVKEVLIDERDRYMAQKIKDAPGKVVLAVIGAGHLQGIEAHLNHETNLAELEQVPPPSVWGKVLQWGIPLFVVSLIAYGFAFIDTKVSQDMILGWILASGSLAALGALVAGAHILTILATFVAAPITGLHPALAAGWVSGLVEAWIKKPTVEDFERLGQDITSFAGFRRNEITRILMVVVFANLGSSIGTIVGITWITSLL